MMENLQALLLQTEKRQKEERIQEREEAERRQKDKTEALFFFFRGGVGVSRR